MKTCIHFASYLSQFFLEWEMFQTEVFRKSCLSGDKKKLRGLSPRANYIDRAAAAGRRSIMWQNFVERAGNRCQYGARALHAGYLMLQTHSEYVILPRLYTATVVAWTLLSVTLHIQYVACLVHFSNRLNGLWSPPCVQIIRYQGSFGGCKSAGSWYWPAISF